MTNYEQLGQEQRYVIDRLLSRGVTRASIAQIIGCHRSTISRELIRNGFARSRSGRIYNPDSAHRKAQQRHRDKPKHKRFTHSMKQLTVQMLTGPKLSPELISILGRRQDPSFVSHETLYRWIWEMKFSHALENRSYQGLYRELRHARRKQKRGNYKDNRGCIANRVSIEQRPKVVEKRSRLGDLELDLMLGLNHQVGILVATDRATLKTFLIKVQSKEPCHIERAIVNKLIPWKGTIRTLTYDNDLAFRNHQRVNNALTAKSYFTHPYTSQEKGTVENRIGLIRRFFPKKTNFSKVSRQQVHRVERLINQRPVRKFNYQSPDAVFLQKSRVALIG